MGHNEETGKALRQAIAIASLTQDQIWERRQRFLEEHALAYDNDDSDNRHEETESAMIHI